MKRISKYLLALFMIIAGVMHFASPEFLMRIMPPYLPFHSELVMVSGVSEILLGVLMLVPQASRLAAWGIVALLIAVFPANIHLDQNQDLMPAPPFVHFLRLPLQGVLVLWAYWHTEPTKKENGVRLETDSP